MEKVYLGCSLTGAPESFKSEVKDLIFLLEKSYTVLPFFSFTNKIAKNNREVFEFDMNQIKEADFMIAICSHPSTGMGYEIKETLSQGKKVFAFAKDGDGVSKFIDNGIIDSNYKFSRVENLKDIINIIFS
ncbi:MAG: nucleoside 2-deoxyribosyltransferase [Candidatus Paceibacterota bacterium]|jgi:nucleoside 2-deoxyribosyltransferase